MHVTMLNQIRKGKPDALVFRCYHALRQRERHKTDIIGGSRKRLLIRHQQRGIIAVARVLRNVFKLRYLVLGGTVSGGVHMKNKYEEWKRDLPDFEWIKDAMPAQENSDKFRETFRSAKEKGAEVVAMGLASFSNWLESVSLAAPADSVGRDNHNETREALGVDVFPAGGNDAHSQHKTDQERVHRLQEELILLQLKYQRELEKLEKENKELRKEILLVRQTKRSGTVPRRLVKKSLIDMYSDVLDELSGCGFDVQDNLPRVVVVGDQSAGKTSVLEMVAQARIFPRGAGEMMTRSPVKVTLSEAAHHTAQFVDSDRVFDLTKESELVQLRREIETRMRRSVADGKTVSNEVISLSVRGPGLHRMVLVDLPGIISTSTTEMAEGTKDSIREMTEFYMKNPNAIILCIQDGSVDAERSMVTELVSRSDPKGQRTIFVLTKVDLAEKNMTNPSRIKKILDGRLFPMQALGRFLVDFTKVNCTCMQA